MEKKTKKNDYSRFYALLKQNPMLEKDEIVSQFTNGRTTHVSQMSRQEFIRMCDSLQYGSPTEQRARELSLKRARSAALLRIGRLGIKTIDNWDGINAFVANPKIAGKKFYDLGVDELNSLVRKLESIIRRGRSEEYGGRGTEEREAEGGGGEVGRGDEHDGDGAGGSKNRGIEVKDKQDIKREDELI